MREFRDIVDTLDIFDLNFSGKFYTWWDSNLSSPIFKKLDRVLVNANWPDVFPLSRAQFFSRGLSDHSPTMTYLGVEAPKLFKPFQVFQHIIENPSFLHTVDSAWCEPIHGDPWFILSMKLKRVKLL